MSGVFVAFERKSPSLQALGHLFSKGGINTSLFHFLTRGIEYWEPGVCCRGHLAVSSIASGCWSVRDWLLRRGWWRPDLDVY